MKKLIHKEESYNIIGACMAVHQELGNCFLEAVYQEALECEFKLRGIPYTREAQLGVYYKGELLKKKYQADFICYGSIIVELKALYELHSNHQSQLINYLKATNLQLGILINFGETSLRSKRVVNKYYSKK